MYDLYDRILGCLVTAAMGDAVGAPSEAYSREEILQKFGKRIDGFMEAGDNVYALGNHRGEVTDDASQIYVFSQAVIRARAPLPYRTPQTPLSIGPSTIRATIRATPAPPPALSWMN